MKLKRLISNWLVAAIFAGTIPTILSAEPQLIPWPARIESQPGEFVLNSQTVIVTDAAFTNEANLLGADLQLKETSAAAANCILLTQTGAENLGPEAYELEVTGHGATIRASTTAGAFYGSRTLVQLAESGSRTIPFTRISDAPRYAWRGLMLDVSRHFFDKPTVLRVVDWMAEYKLNRLHLHLTDDPGWRLEIPGYPALTQIGAQGNYSESNAPPCFFTQADAREITAYAAQRHIVVVPEIDMPGHAGAAIRSLPQLDGGAHTFNPDQPETYDFLQNVLLSVMDDFPSPWIHFGGDEVNLAAWNHSSTQKTNSLGKAQAVENAFDRHMADFIRQHGRTPAGWDEITAAATQTNTIIFWWRHDKPEVLANALAAGHPVVLAPRAPCYFDYPQDEAFSIPTGRKLYNTLASVYQGPQIPAGIPTAERSQILGVEACVWTEHIDTVPYLEFMTLPRLAALGEMAWTPDESRNFSRFDARLKPFLDQYRKDGIHFYDETNPQGSLDDAKTLSQAASLHRNSGFNN